MDNDTDIERQLNEITRYLRELVSYTRRDELAQALDNPEKTLAYRLSDGERSARVVKEVGELSVSPRTIQRWWNDWVEKELAHRTNDGQARRRYDPVVLKSEVVDNE